MRSARTAQVKAAVITGSGSAFCSGADLTQEGGPLEMPPERRLPTPNTARADGILYGWFRLMEAIWHSEKANHFRSVILQKRTFPACKRCSWLYSF